MIPMLVFLSVVLPRIRGRRDSWRRSCLIMILSILFMLVFPWRTIAVPVLILRSSGFRSILRGRRAIMVKLISRRVMLIGRRCGRWTRFTRRGVTVRSRQSLLRTRIIVILLILIMRRKRRRGWVVCFRKFRRLRRWRFIIISLFLTNTLKPLILMSIIVVHKSSGTVSSRPRPVTVIRRG